MISALSRISQLWVRMTFNCLIHLRDLIDINVFNIQLLRQADCEKQDIEKAFFCLHLQIVSSKYKKELQDWKKQKNFMTKIINHIYDITTITNLNFIQIIEVHSWNVLRALKARFSFFDSVKSLKLKQQYNRMIRESINRQSIDVWLNDYLKMFTLTKQADIAEIIDSKRVYRDFLHVIEKIALIFAEIYELQLKAVMNHEIQFIVIIDIFRHHMRMKKARKERETIFNSTFVVDENKESEKSHNHDHSFSSSFRNKQQKQSLCYCGKKHSYENCYYINENIRSKEWTLKSEIMTKIIEVMKNSKKKKFIENNIKRFDERRQEKRQKKDENKNTEKKIKFFVVMQIDNVMKSFTNDFFFNYVFRSSWIVNHDFDIHVINKTMKHRFQKKRDCTDEFMMVSEMKSFFILIYDRMNIIVNTFTEKKSMKLLNVNYVSNFMINIVAKNILVDKELHFDTIHDHLHKNDIFIVFVSRIKTHYVLENNKKFEETSNFAVTIRKNSTSKWHQLLVHASNDAIQHLQQTVEEMKLTNKDKMSLINKCEKCALFKAHKIVFRSHEKSETSNKPFYRIIYDLIDMTTTLNKHKWISHVTCFETNFYMMYTHESKRSATEILIKAIHIIETRYKNKMMFVRFDDERSLNNAWNIYCVFKNISFEASIVDTSTQNDHIERLNAILLTKSRIMRLETNLSVYLWSWINEIVDYLMNRTFFKKHNWKTSFEMITDKKSNLIHIVRYEAKAYFLNKDISRKKKMRSKTHLDFLIEYDNINIFLIWISSQRKIIRTRNVTFNENLSYRFNEINLTQFINEFFLTNDTLNISQSDFTKITNIESDSEKELWKLTFIEFITTHDDTFEETSEEMNDIEHDYLFSSVSSSSKNENTSDTSKFSSSTSSSLDETASSLKTKKSKHWQKTAIDETNIQSEKISRTRKPNSLRGFNHYTALKDAHEKKIRSFYETFTISMTKKKKSHRDDLLSESKFYHQMIKHSEIIDFLRVIDVEIKTL